jgi:DNA (cytosine-5)-methyltransferase 1
MKKLQVASVFSGIGAFEFALKRLNIEHDIVFACDNGDVELNIESENTFKKIRLLNDPKEKKNYVDELYRLNSKKSNFVKKSYIENYSDNFNSELFFQDIRLLDGYDFNKKIDIFVGGSPCQSFSIVGSQKGLDDARGTLFYDYARLIKEIEPKVFIFENVRGLLTHDKGNTWKIIKNIFESLDYYIDYDILNSKDFGIPQNRNRIFVVGSKKTRFNLKSINKKELELELSDLLETTSSKMSFDNDNGQLLIDKNRGDVDKKYFLTEKLYNYVMNTGTKNFYSKPKIDLKVARPILKTMGNRHRAGIDNYITIDGKVRMLTEKEALRLMGFTDEFKIVVSRAQAYKQAGNSIVVDILIEIINLILKNESFE